MIISSNQPTLYFVIDELYHIFNLTNGTYKYLDVLNYKKDLYSAFPPDAIENIKFNTSLDVYLHNILFRNVNLTNKYYGLTEEDTKECVNNNIEVGTDYFNNLSVDNVKETDKLYHFIQLDTNKIFIVINKLFGKMIKFDRYYKDTFFNDLLDYLVNISRYDNSKYFFDIFSEIYHNSTK